MTKILKLQKISMLILAAIASSYIHAAAMSSTEPKDIGEALIRAVHKNDLSSISALLASGADVNDYSKDPDGGLPYELRNAFPPLFAAVVDTNIKACELLLAHGANAKARVLNDKSILRIAIERLMGSVIDTLTKEEEECITVIRLLINAGAEVAGELDKDGTPVGLLSEYSYVAATEDDTDVATLERLKKALAELLPSSHA